ncbi:MAG: hypothetical protein ACRD0N_06805 [Acidimicrobiales bacterium]
MGGGRGGQRAAARGRVVLALAPLLLAACERPSDDFPPPPQTVQVGMTEYRFDLRAPGAAGRIVFEARNRGSVDHELVLVGVPENLPPIGEQLRSGERVVVPTVARMAPHGPGTRGTFAVDLEPGRYAVVCFVKDADGEQHDQKGMSAEFTIE